MKTKTSTVMLKQFPPDLTLKQTRIFLDEIQNEMKIEKPRLVLDCTHMRQIDDSVLYLLLCCLEEAIKRNGDVKLAAVSSEVSTALTKAGVSRLFEVFPTAVEAVASFQRFTTAPVTLEPSAKSSVYEAESVTR